MAFHGPDRAVDELHLKWVDLRAAGRNSGQIARAYGVTQEKVRIATNRIRSDYEKSTGGQDVISWR